MTHDVGPPLASDSSVCLPSSRTISERATLGSVRGTSTHPHRRLRNELAYPATAQWAFLTSTPQHLDCRHHHQPVQPSRPATARKSISPKCVKLPRRPATSRGSKNQDIHEKQKELLTPRGAIVVIQEAIRRERVQEQYVGPLIGRGVEPLRQSTPRECHKPKTGGAETSTVALLSRARGVTTASMNATERLRLRAFQARANGEYDRAIKFYTELSTARPKEIEAHFHLAVCLERTGQLAPALAAYKQVQKLSAGHHAFAYYNMGNICMRAERVPQAIEYFSRAITARKGYSASACNSDNSQNSSIGSTPIAFYRQRAAAYRKNGDFEKAARDYVLIQRCANAAISAPPVEDDAVYTAEHLYQPAIRASTSNFTSQQKEIAKVDSETVQDVNGEDDHNQQETNQPPEIDVEESEDALTSWSLQQSIAIARLHPSERSESDLQYLVDFMQKRFSVCAALHPDVCNLLCRELVLSPEGALPAKTPIFMEHEGGMDYPPRDRTLFFILRGRVAICKTAGRMFQTSPQKQQEEIHKALEENERCEHEDCVWQSPWESRHPVVNAEWRQSQLELCELEHGEVFGHQGKFSDAPRSYSAVTTTSCAIGALPWTTWRRIDRAQHEAEQERAARFLAMTPAFTGISTADIRNLACRATFVKVVGSKALCCEGQFVDGLLIVREGELCQFSPCGLKAPPDMSVSFALSGALSVPQSGRAFFIQLESLGDPVGFLRVNEAFHGFLHQNYVLHKQRELLRLATAHFKSGSRSKSAGIERHNTILEPLAVALRRGECFSVSSSWIPPRQSRQEKKSISQGVACAKTALISVATAELLFLSSADLTKELSLDSRTQLHRNLQDIALLDSQRKITAEGTVGQRFRRAPSGRRSANLLEQYVRDAHWSKFKEDLVDNVLRGRS